MGTLDRCSGRFESNWIAIAGGRRQAPVRRAGRKFHRLAAITLAALLCCGLGYAQETAAVFKANCASCHTIGGGRLTGPDLKDVATRKDRDWLRSFILNPQSKINSGDPYALQLLDEARGVVMPQVPGLTPEMVDFLLDLIEAESALEESQFKGIQVSMEPFTPEDVARGMAIFKGRQSLSNGGPSCVACHTVPGIGGLGGGNVGPDLTLVFERLQGRVSLSAWLQSPATPTMQSALRDTPLRPDEIHALVALFEDTAKKDTPVQSAVAQLSFLFLGLGGAVLALVAFDFIWKGRLRGVRRPLVQATKL
ncbi:MAG: c-type cytochrome [Candidatus Hydrogenedentes bacterium]|nr:c-type cytochrome [Candidatus Hydrogenedentota bacterium]